MLSQFDNDRPVIMRGRFPAALRRLVGRTGVATENATSGDTATQTRARQPSPVVTKAPELPWGILTSSTLLPIAAGLSAYERTG
jgi:hypothetical protein